MVTDDFSPMYAGDTLNPFSPQFSYRDGSPVNLTNATITLVMVNSAPYSRQAGTGTWVIDNAAAGQAHYNWSSADVSTPGTWTIQVEIVVGGEPLHFDSKILQIDPPL
jgi:hypothetical protein